MKNKLSKKPASKKYLDYFIDVVFTPLLKGESNIIYSIPKSGTNSFIKYCLKFSNKFNSKLADKITKQDIIELNLSEASTKKSFEDDFMRQFSKLTGKKLSNSNELISAISSLGKAIWVLIYNFDKLEKNRIIFDTLVKYYSANTAFMKFLLSYYGEDPKDTKLSTRLGLNKSAYIKLRDKNDIEILLENEEEWYEYKIPDHIKTRIAKLSGGYSALSRALLSLAKENFAKFKSYKITELSTNQIISKWLDLVYNSLADKTSDNLKQWFINRDTELNSEFLKETGVLVEKKLFSKLFYHYLIKKINEEGKINGKTSSLQFHDNNLEDILSKQEYDVISVLYKSKGKVISRKRIARIMWQANWRDNYSDWAIDKIISKIRKKIFDTEKSRIQTVKGKGFKLVQ